MDADVSEIYRFAEDMTGVPPRLLAKARVAVQAATLGTERDAKIFVPVDTGNLRNSIYSSFSGNAFFSRGEVGPTADYGDFVERGTSRMSPQPYMGPATERNAALFHEASASIAREEL